MPAPGPLTSTSTLSDVTNGYFDRKLLRRALPRLPHMQVAQRRPLPARETKIIRFRRLEAFPLAQVPLTEGVPPNANVLDPTDLLATVLQWGAFARISDLRQVTMEHPIVNDTVRLQAEQAAQTVDANARDEFVTGSSVFYGNAETARSSLTTTTHAISTAILDRVIRYLHGGNATPFTEMINPTTKISTTPVWEAYWAIVHPDIVFTLNHLSGWTPIADYPSQGGTMPGEVGAYKNIRFIQSTQAKVYAGGGGVASGDVKSTSSNADVYATLVFGMDAVGVVPLDMMSLESIIHPIGSAGAAVPLNQYGTVGWKYSGTQLVLNDAFMTRIETTARNANPV